jgi:hypothetical protein
MELRIFENRVHSVFELLGDKENDISFSVGYAFSQSKTLIQDFLAHIGVLSDVNPTLTKVLLQQYENGKGYTDFEIVQGDDYHIIIEAKRGWVFPDIEQLTKYSSRDGFTNSPAKHKVIVVFNESTPEFAFANFPIQEINGIDVKVVSWKKIQELSITAIKRTRNAERLFLSELVLYLDQVSMMQQKESNWAYVVSLGSNIPEGWQISFTDIVEKKGLYFHPVGGGKGGWPTEPPNYIAFRYKGKLQSIHHIDGYEVFTDPSVFFPEIPSGNWGPCFLYKLGTGIKPIHEVKAGPKIQRSMRVWAMIDLLLTCSTIEEARDKSKLRSVTK